MERRYTELSFLPAPALVGGLQEPKANLKGLVPTLMGAAAKGAEEAAPALREAAQGFMVAFTVRVSNRTQLRARPAATCRCNLATF